MEEQFDRLLNNWLEEHKGENLVYTACLCPKCGLYYKESLGHECAKFYKKEEEKDD